MVNIFFLIFYFLTIIFNKVLYPLSLRITKIVTFARFYNRTY